MALFISRTFPAEGEPQEGRQRRGSEPGHGVVVLLRENLPEPLGQGAPRRSRGGQVDDDSLDPVEEVGGTVRLDLLVRSRLVAGQTGKSDFLQLLPPADVTRFSSRTRRNFTCRSGGISDTSSRKSVPGRLLDSCPSASRSAPVKARARGQKLGLDDLRGIAPSSGPRRRAPAAASCGGAHSATSLLARPGLADDEDRRLRRGATRSMSKSRSIDAETPRSSQPKRFVVPLAQLA